MIRAQNSSDSETIFSVSVMSKDIWLNGLIAKDFLVSDDDHVQAITSFETGESPISVSFLIDKSGSTTDVSLNAIPATLLAFVKASNPKNEYSLVTFDSELHVLLEASQDTKIIENTIEKLSQTRPSGNTQLFDSMNTCLNKLSKAKFKRRVLIIYSDTFDNVSKMGLGDLTNVVKRSSVLIYNIRIYDSRLIASSDTLSIAQLHAMDDLVDRTGGKVFLSTKRTVLNENLKWIADDLRNQYVIGLRPTNKSIANGKKWHKVEIKIDPSKKRTLGGKIIIRTRRGYYAE